MTAKPVGLSVRAIIFGPDQQILTLRRSAACRHFANQWELPGGKVEPGEDVHEAIIREVGEETGLSIQVGRLAGFCESEMLEVRAVQVFFEATAGPGEVRLSDEHDAMAWAVAGDLSREELYSPQVYPFLKAYGPAFRPPTSELLPALMNISVKGVVHNSSGQVLLVRRSQSSKANPAKWEFPGGKVDAGESMNEGLIREIHEETGLAITVGNVIGICEGHLPMRRVVYLIFEADATNETVRLSEEHDAFAWTALSDLMTFDLSPSFRQMAESVAINGIQPNILEN